MPCPGLLGLFVGMVFVVGNWYSLVAAGEQRDVKQKTLLARINQGLLYHTKPCLSLGMDYLGTKATAKPQDATSPHLGLVARNSD